MRKIIEILLQSASVGSGFKDTVDNAKRVSASMSDLQDGVRKLGLVFGSLGGIAGNALANILKGGIWGAMAEGVRIVIGLIGKWRDRAKQAAAEVQKKFEQTVAAVKDGAKAAGDAVAAAISNSERRAKMYDAEIAKIAALKKAIVELNRERNIAAGMSREEAERRASSENEDIDLDTAEKKAKNQLKVARNTRDRLADLETKRVDDYAKARAVADRADREYYKRREEYAKKNSQKAGRYTMGIVSYEISEEQAAASREQARQKFDTTDEGKRLAGNIKAAKDAIDALREESAKTTRDVESANAAIAAALSDLEAVSKRRQAKALEEENRLAEAGKLAAEKAAKEKADAAEKAAKAEADAFAKAQKDMMDEQKRVQNEIERRKQEAIAKRIEIMRQANAKELAEIDKRIAAEREKEKKWEEEAKGMREAAAGGGKGLGDFFRARRDQAREDRRLERNRRVALDRVNREIADLERRDVRGRGLNDAQRERLKELKDFVNRQDPKNNPAAKAAAELEKKKLAAIEKMQKAIDDLKTSIEQRTVL